MSRRQRNLNLTAFLIGLAATAAIIGGDALGWLEWVELKTLDLRFRHANSIPEDERITCIDIDDASLQKVGRWPWPRDQQAGLLAVLTELGAQAILVDLTFSEPETVRLETPPDVDIVAGLSELTSRSWRRLLPDDELQAAIADAGNVYLAMHYDPDTWDHSSDFREVVAAVRNSREEPAPLARRLGVSVQRVEWLAQAARVTLAIEADKLLDDEAVAASLGLSPAFMREVFEKCRQFVLRDYVREYLAEQPQQQAFRALYRRLTARPFEDEAALRTALAKAWRDVLSYEATTCKQLVPVDRIGDIALPVDAIAPVYFAHAQAARRCGFVAFEPDDDSIMRRNALFARHDDRVLNQLAFAVACDVLGVTGDDIEVRDGRLILHRREPEETPLVIQLDRGGRLLMPWVSEVEWTQQFGEHVPADVVWTVHDCRRQQAHNLQLLNENRHDLFGGSLLDNNAEYRAKLDELRRCEGVPGAARRRESKQQAVVKKLMGELAALESRLREQLPDDAFVLGQVEKLDELATQVAAANTRLQHEIDETLAWLQPRIEDKICLIGYTATSLADMTPIPTHPRAPGVIAHANLLNGLLTGRLVRWAPAELNALLACACGVVVSLVSIRRRPREAAVVVAGLILGLVGIAGYWVFYSQTYWVALTPAVGAMLAAYFAIAIYRYIFLDREQRQLTTALSQYTSATLARKMAEDAELCRRAEMREVSAMFTDLRGFTPISERIGAERTQRVLNVFLGRCSEVMLRHEAMINKFIGDGIFAFWNPVIYPQPDHALRACETAVDLQVAMRELAQEQREAGGDEVFGELVQRVGVATGQAVVGPCGSEQKFDYTCIGDTVNLASRLESANKFYATRIIIGGATHDAVADRFEVRPLGGVRVKGKLQPVPIYELLGRKGEVSEELCEYARDFGKAVTEFQRRGWSAAAQTLAACRERRPDDLAAQRYAEATAQFDSQPPPDDWNAAIELTEK